MKTTQGAMCLVAKLWKWWECLGLPRELKFVLLDLFLSVNSVIHTHAYTHII